MLWYLGDQCGGTLGTVVHACLEAASAARASVKPIQTSSSAVAATVPAESTDDANTTGM